MLMSILDEIVRFVKSLGSLMWVSEYYGGGVDNCSEI